ncbi:MAG: TonB-dependent receptor [Chitinophagaceae bacterium]|nr:MAG: TonB-dependent receptor [Chitinophagaceae bacterium]
MKQARRYVLLFCGWYLPAQLIAQHRDTLPVITIVAKEAIDISKTSVPVQQFHKKELARMNSLSVADAAKYFPGVLIKDYGGIGGLKTISVRSLGANHTGIMYDGMVVGDAQGGQVDLGRFSLDNIYNIQLSISRPESRLLTARAYASAAILSLTSGTENVQGKSLSLRIKAGSFGFFSPSVLWMDKIDKRISHAISTEYQSADGDYPYKNYVAGNADSRRENSDIKNYRVEYDAALLVNDSNKVKFKIYYFNSKRGLPGSVVLYNDFSGERLNNEIFFSQISWQKKFSWRSSLLLNSRISRDYKYYIDPTYQNSAGKLENEFHQQELYFSAAYKYQFNPQFSASYSSDYFHEKLKRTDIFSGGFAQPRRDNFLNNIAFDYSRGRWNVNANLLLTQLREGVQNGATGRDITQVSPAVATSYHLKDSSPVHLRAFYKRIFRAPTFNDLYYTNVGNTDLRPEFVDQYNLGFTFQKERMGALETILVTADAYYNKVKDKILAVPREDLFQWTMLNIEKVQIKGLDLSANTGWFLKNLHFSARVAYTYQDAANFSDRSSSSYKNQLAYTPKHSGAIGFGMEYKQFTINYNGVLSSYRYRLGDQIPENVVKEWASHDISLGYRLTTKTGRSDYRLTFELNNIFNSQYEVIKFYPMPRLNYRIGIIANFNQL